MLDLWIALEALFVPDGRRGEITYKVHRRIPLFLSRERHERIRIADVIKRSYDARSKIVHGDTVTDLASITSETEEVLRAALRRWPEMKGSKDPNKAVKIIDDSMFGESSL